MPLTTYQSEAVAFIRLMTAIRKIVTNTRTRFISNFSRYHNYKFPHISSALTKPLSEYFGVLAEHYTAFLKTYNILQHFRNFLAYSGALEKQLVHFGK